jgi:hypothetical protein
MKLEEKYPDLDIRITNICKMIFEDGYTDLAKVMWRMSCGSRCKAFDIANQMVARYGYEPMSIEDFDDACAEIIGGIEVEWDNE